MTSKLTHKWLNMVQKLAYNVLTPSMPKKKYKRVKSKQEGRGRRDLKPDGRKEIETLASFEKSEF